MGEEEESFDAALAEEFDAEWGDEDIESSVHTVLQPDAQQGAGGPHQGSLGSANSQAVELLSLPGELLFRVLCFLNADDLRVCCTLSKALYTAARDDFLWRRLYIARWGSAESFNDLEGHVPWKVRYSRKDGQDAESMLESVPEDLKESFAEMLKAKRQLSIDVIKPEELLTPMAEKLSTLAAWRKRKGFSDQPVARPADITDTVALPPRSRSHAATNARHSHHGRPGHHCHHQNNAGGGTGSGASSSGVNNSSSSDGDVGGVGGAELGVAGRSGSGSATIKRRRVMTQLDKDLYVCEETGWVHVCGDACTEFIEDHDSQLLVCPISGLCKARLMSDAELREECWFGGDGPAALEEGAEGGDEFGGLRTLYTDGYNCANLKELKQLLGIR